MTTTEDIDRPLSLRRAAALLGCSQTAVSDLLRRGVLADSHPTTVRALAASGWRPTRSAVTRPGWLKYRVAADILGCAPSTVVGLLSRGYLSDLRRETVEAFAPRYRAEMYREAD